ncbi:glycoside hydrolase family 130 protein [Novosphingobium sp. G106]|uniref:glycoside hydrolase family 130 protein n=1 Tax=Novosphingobium sp. G106 TaxID=2849500 RepID=UPI001C2D66E5|nr:glycoside hydrolase family 130 protein [Novosphingobium sp. G106]MBV1688833.1 glycoside hydrolase family 130 protein [Novosphingobium sp. G106]
MEQLADITDIVTLSDVTLRPNSGRTIIRPFVPQDPREYADPARPRPQRIVDRVLALSDGGMRRILEPLLETMRGRVQQPERYLLRRFDEVNGTAFAPCVVSDERRQLIAAYFCGEYSFEAAALFNPSMIPKLENPLLPDGRVQFVLGLRAVGEGHVSSVTFRTGRWSAATGFEIDPAGNEGTLLREASTEGDGDETITHLVAAEDRPLSEMVIFPITPSQSQGIEDMRLVVFADDDGTRQIYGTYTAYDGREARPEMLHRARGKEVQFRRLKGRLATGKGMALFPRKVDGQYLMLSRQDQENVWLLRSDDPYRWDEGAKLLEPAEPWEFVQLGNCGSPIEIDEGWLVLTHAVGPVRSYAMGACLLDRRDPFRVIARLRSPLLRPTPVGGRDGYVPNVVYSCGGMVHDRTLLLPFAVADSITRFASIPVDGLLGAMSRSY